jgi:hypothetical protein
MKDINNTNLLKETLITPEQAQQYLPVQKTVTTIKYWINVGCEGKKLESVKVGGRRYTSIEALQRFIHVPCKEPPTRQTQKDYIHPKVMPEELLEIKTRQYGL